MRWLIAFILVMGELLPPALGVENSGDPKTSHGLRQRSPDSQETAENCRGVACDARSETSFGITSTDCRVAVSGNNGEPPAGYVPPVLGNGALSLLVDYQGAQSQQAFAQMIPSIWWAGRRYGPPNDQLIPFGHFEQALSCNEQPCGAPARWRQTLNTKDALVTTQCDYGDPLTVETTAFVHLAHDVVAIKKRFIPKNPSLRSVRMDFTYQFSPPSKKNQLPRRTVLHPAWDDKAQCLDIRYQVDGHRLYDGMLSILADKPVNAHLDQQTFTLTADIAFNAGQPAEITFYLLFADSMDGKDFAKRSAQLKALVKAEGFAGLLKTHQQEWGSYWDESYVHIPAAQVEKAYNTAQYHLRANATKWSMPVGICNTHWAGRFFGWDEMFCFLGLASSGHLSISKRVPEFRLAGLRKAVERTSRYFTNTESFGARYPWETLEDGTEGAPPGFWHDHVFHMSSIARSSWDQYLYSGDLEFLKATAYPVIKECATFFLKQMVYEDSNGSMFLGKCTDLERLGPGRQNPFLTSCGAIFTLEAASAAAHLLKTDENLAESWSRTAGKLRQSLPHNTTQYVPYAGCPDASIAVLGGLFPYPVLGTNDVLQRNAAYEFVRNGVRYGNMYPMGESVCAWYAGWMAAALAALGDKTEPAKLLAQAVEGTGCFSEFFEIKETKVVMHPWFSTAEGNYVYALNQMLVQCRDDQILIAPAVPDDWRDFSFKLPCYGNLVATVSVKAGRIEKLVLSPGDAGTTLKRTLVIPERLFDERALNKKQLVSMTTQAGCRLLDVQFKGQIVLLEASR